MIKTSPALQNGAGGGDGGLPSQEEEKGRRRGGGSWGSNPPPLESRGLSPTPRRREERGERWGGGLQPCAPRLPHPGPTAAPRLTGALVVLARLALARPAGLHGDGHADAAAARRHARHLRPRVLRRVVALHRVQERVAIVAPCAHMASGPPPRGPPAPKALLRWDPPHYYDG